MALFNECMPQCAQKVFDIADIVRDRDLSPIETMAYELAGRITSRPPTHPESLPSACNVRLRL